MPGEEALQSSATKRRFFYGYIVVLAAFVIIAVAYSTFFTYGIFFKPVLAEFGWTRTMMSGALSLNTLLWGLFSIITGRLTDRLGPRLVVVACSFLLGLGYFLMSQVGAVWQLYLFYGVIVAAGMSGGITPLSSTVGRWFVKRRGLMMGIVMAGMAVGIIIGPPLATRLISIYEWRTSFVILCSIALVCIMVAAQFLRRDPAQMGQLPYGEAQATSNNVVRQNPNLEARGFSLKEAAETRNFWMLLIMYFCLLLCLMLITAHIVPYATDIGISTMIAASVMSVFGIASVLGILAMGIIADRIGNKLSLIIGFTLLTAALFWLPIAKEAWSLYLFATVFGLGFGGLTTVFPLVTAELFGLSSYGAVFGTIVFGGTVGGSIGPVLAGWIFDISNSYSLAFIIMAMLAAVALVLSFAVKKAPRSKEGNLG
jgi:MFS family permease